MTRYGGHTYCSNVYPQQFLLNYYEERGQQLGLFGNRFQATTNNRSYIVFCTSLENFCFSLFLLTPTLAQLWPDASDGRPRVYYSCKHYYSIFFLHCTGKIEKLLHSCLLPEREGTARQIAKYLGGHPSTRDRRSGLTETSKLATGNHSATPRPWKLIWRIKIK